MAPFDHARGEIVDLLARVVYEGDGGDLDAYCGLLTDDVTWSMPGVDHRGIEAVRAGMESRRRDGVVGPGSGARHVLTTTTVGAAPEGDPDTAIVRSTWLLVGESPTAGSPPGAVTLLRVGTYDDVVRRTPSGWRLAARRISFGAG